MPKNYEKCPFYFWFHTGFVEEGKLVLGREELDNPHKSKTWHCFRGSLKVELRLEYCKEQQGSNTSRFIINVKIITAKNEIYFC